MKNFDNQNIHKKYVSSLLPKVLQLMISKTSNTWGEVGMMINNKIPSQLVKVSVSRGQKGVTILLSVIFW